MSEIRNLILDGMDYTYDQYDGRTPDHVILPASQKDEVTLEKIRPSDDGFEIVSQKDRGLLSMQVWFSQALDKRNKKVLLLSDQAFASIFQTTKDFYTEGV